MDRKLFFILFDSRSGSTFLAKNLVKYSNIAIPPETNFVKQLYDSGLRTLKTRKAILDAVDIARKEPKFSDLNITEQELLESLPASKMHIFDLISKIYNLWCDKHDPNTSHIGIKKTFPSIHRQLYTDSNKTLKTIWLIRDGRAVYRSKLNSIMSSTGKPFVKTSLQAAKEWVTINQKIGALSASCPVKKVVFETFLENPNLSLQKICSFLNSDFLSEERSEAYYEIPQRYGQKLHSNINSAPLKNKKSEWTESLTKTQIRNFEFLAGLELKRHGYRLHSIKQTLCLKLGECCRRALYKL